MSKIVWYSMDTPPMDLRGVLVAVDIDGHCVVERGTRNRRGDLRAVGINTKPYAWTYLPMPPSNRDIRPLTGKDKP